MYRSSAPASQAFIRELIRLIMEDYFSATFLNFPEMLELSSRARVCLTISLGKNSLIISVICSSAMKAFLLSRASTNP